jgi:hypothetical protein
MCFLDPVRMLELLGIIRIAVLVVITNTRLYSGETLGLLAIIRVAVIGLVPSGFLDSGEPVRTLESY